MDGDSVADHRYNSQPGESLLLTASKPAVFSDHICQVRLCEKYMHDKEFLKLIGTQVKDCGEINCGSLLAAPIEGYLLGILSACLSALAGIYTEFLMKKNQDSLYWQNMQLYA